MEACVAALAADLKLLVDGSWRRLLAWDGGMLDPCARIYLPPGTARMEPRGVVARWISSAGGGDEGLGGGPSAPILRSGIKLGGGMALGGGGAFGGGGRDIIGGLVLSAALSRMLPVVDEEGTRERPV